MSQPAADDVDHLLSDYFKSRLPHPWPAAPVSTEPVRRPHRSDNRARYTLAASVAILIGDCWYFSNTSQPAARPGDKPATGAPGILQDGSAKMPKEFENKKEPMLD